LFVEPIQVTGLYFTVKICILVLQF